MPLVIAGATSGSTTIQATDAVTATITLPNTSGIVVVTATGVAGFPSGTRMSFQQTAAPTGWTKDTTAAINDSILRFVTGAASSGGSLAFSTWAAQTTDGATTLSTAQIPSHTHVRGAFYTGNNVNWSYTNIHHGSDNSGADGSWETGAAGGGGSHTHSLSQALKYYDFIIATAN